MKIVELDAHSVNPGDLSWDEIKALGNLDLYDRTAPEDVIKRAKDADAILINKINISEEVIAALPKLRYIGEMATGFNNIDINAAKRHGITVTNIPAYSTDSVAHWYLPISSTLPTMWTTTQLRHVAAHGAATRISAIGTRRL